MTIDCPYFNFKDQFPHLYDLAKRYDALLKQHGFEISIRDTEHSDDSVRWSIHSVGGTITDIVTNIARQFKKDFYSTCQKCGKKTNSEMNQHFTGDNAYPFYGSIPDNGILCDECLGYERYRRLIGHGKKIEDWLSQMILCTHSDKNEDKELLKFIKQHKLMFLDKYGRISYCKFGDIKEYNNEWYLSTPNRTSGFLGMMKRAFSKKTPFDIPNEYKAVSITPLGYDMGVRDIYGDRVYSNTTAVILYENRMYPSDNYTIPESHCWEMVKKGRIIVTGYLFHLSNKKILTDNYKLTYKELVSIIGEEEAKLFLANPDNCLQI